ncbi:hypothetical protein [Microbulbifer mangrovi]|uniref:hypothetical protein n=1 Tax=Microbulbifer mangrovi TaxID=927787 RepID=UPI00117E0ED2|nr:hypothetical protein [Microbulbifer mangrovi]
MTNRISDEISYLVSALESNIKAGAIGSNEALNIVDQIRLKNLELSRRLEGNSLEFVTAAEIENAEVGVQRALKLARDKYKSINTDSLIKSFLNFQDSSRFHGWYQPSEGEHYIWSGPETESTLVLSGMSGAKYFGFKVRCNVEKSVNLKAWLSVSLNSCAVRYDFKKIGDENILVISKPVDTDICEVDFFIEKIYSPKELFTSLDERHLGICISGAWKISDEFKFEVL